MKTILRDHLIAEELIRSHIRQRITAQIRQQLITEEKIRPLIRKLLETETGTEEPSEYTGINVLANLLQKVIPVIEDDYKMLTTSPEQRESFKNHIIHAIKNALKPIEVSSAAEKLPENFEFEIDQRYLLREKLSIDLDPMGDGEEEESVEGEFIDIEGEEDDGFVQIDDQNETGRNFAAVTFNQVEKQIIDAYDMLADEEDQKLFYDYLLTNMLLYFDKFEDELSNSLPETTTTEYEQEKSEEEDSAPLADMPASDEETPEDGAGEEEIDLFSEE